MMRQTPFSHDRDATTDDTGQAFGGHRHVLQTHAGVRDEVVDAMPGLLDQQIAKNFSGQVFGFTVNFFQPPDKSVRCRSEPTSCG